MDDFNLPSMDWCTNPPKSSSTIDASFLDCINSLERTQWVHESAFLCSGTILDLIVTSRFRQDCTDKSAFTITRVSSLHAMFEYAFVADHSQYSDILCFFVSIYCGMTPAVLSCYDLLSVS